VPPGNRLEALRGDLAGFHSIRVNDQRRIIFRWAANGPEEVANVDYHRHHLYNVTRYGSEPTHYPRRDTP